MLHHIVVEHYLRQVLVDPPLLRVKVLPVIIILPSLKPGFWHQFVVRKVKDADLFVFGDTLEHLNVNPRIKHGVICQVYLSQLIRRFYAVCQDKIRLNGHLGAYQP